MELNFSSAADQPLGQPRRDLANIAILLALAVVLRIWLISHTEVPARDGIGFIRFAWQLRTMPWPTVLRGNPHPPLYPLAILATSIPMRFLIPGSEATMMQLSAQAASALAGILVVIPMYCLGLRLFNRQTAFWACAVFQCLPIACRSFSDALSEGLFLLLLATALLLAYQALQNHSTWRFALSGIFGGLAYLTRPEGLVIVIAVLAVLLALWIRPGRLSRRKLFTGATVLALGAILVGSPYALVIGRLTNKTTGMDVLRADAGPFKDWDQEKGPLADAAPDGTQSQMKMSGHVRGVRRSISDLVLSAAPLAVYWSDAKHQAVVRRLRWSLSAVCSELLRSFHYVGWLPTLLAALYYFSRHKHNPGAWIVVAVCALQLIALWRVAYVAGYVSDRHSLIFLLIGVYWAVAGTFIIGPRLAGLWHWLGCRFFRNWSRLNSDGSTLSGPRSTDDLWAVGLVVTFICLLMPKTLEPLHSTRAGYHAAGLWLAGHAGPGDQIVDPFCWAEYYAGQIFAYRTSASQTTRAAKQFVVLGCSDNEHERLPLIPVAESLAKEGTLVYEWDPPRSKRKAEKVVIYCVPPKPESGS
jgi:hypothetical protein